MVKTVTFHKSTDDQQKGRANRKTRRKPFAPKRANESKMVDDNDKNHSELFSALVHCDKKIKILDKCKKNYAAKNTFVAFVNGSLLSKEHVTDCEAAYEKLSKIKFHSLTPNSITFFPILNTIFGDELLTPIEEVVTNSPNRTHTSSLTAEDSVTYESDDSYKTVVPSSELTTAALKTFIDAAADEAKRRLLSFDDFQVCAYAFFNGKNLKGSGVMEDLSKDWPDVTAVARDDISHSSSHFDGLAKAATNALAKWKEEHVLSYTTTHDGICMDDFVFQFK